MEEENNIATLPYKSNENTDSFGKLLKNKDFTTLAAKLESEGQILANTISIIRTGRDLNNKGFSQEYQFKLMMKYIDKILPSMQYKDINQNINETKADIDFSKMSDDDIKTMKRILNTAKNNS